MHHRANRYRKIAITCFFASAAAAVTAASLLITAIANKPPPSPAILGIYAASLILYGAGTALAVYAEELAAPLPAKPPKPDTSRPAK